MKRWKTRSLLVILALVLLVSADTLRRPADQITASSYIGVVHLYQTYGRPLLAGVVACRFRPTCSEYSIMAVEKYGIITGLYMTVRRLAACDNSVQMGTVDEVL